MRRYTHATAAASKPVPAETGVTGYYTKGNPGTGVPASILTEEWHNDVQEELLDVILAAGLTPAANTTQLRAALLALITPTGTMLQGLWATAAPGWVMMNDGTIGNFASGATTRANADTAALYTMVYTNVINTWAPVSGGRTGNAAADFAANKTLKIPRALGCAIAAAGTGLGLTTRALGEFFGEERHSLIESELAPHIHRVGTNPIGGTGGGGTYVAQYSSPVTAANSESIGLGTPHNTMQPTLFVNFMIKL